MKTYSSPRLVAQGSVVAMTLGPIGGRTDPDELTELMTVGSVGFNL